MEGSDAAAAAGKSYKAPHWYTGEHFYTGSRRSLTMNVHAHMERVLNLRGLQIVAVFFFLGILENKKNTRSSIRCRYARICDILVRDQKLGI